jgi:hypothetical protein
MARRGEGEKEISNDEQGIMNDEGTGGVIIVESDPSIFNIPCSIFIIHLYSSPPLSLSSLFLTHSS